MNDTSGTYNSQVSGIVPDDFQGIEANFTQLSEIHSLGPCRLVKAMRYGRWHVLKGLKGEHAADVAYTQRLRKELEMMMRLSHPAIAQVYGMERGNINPEIGMDSFIVMEWVDGVTLDEWLANNPSQTLRRRVANELLDAVGYMHRQGIVHRDLKPENVMITRNGSNVKIIDMGLADNDSYAVFKNPAGTENYIAPEQLKSTEADSRNDIYSLGIVLNLMHLGSSYKGIIKKCLKPINERYQTVDEMIEEIASRKRLHQYIRVAGLAVALSLLVAGIILGLGYAGKKKLENPSGVYSFSQNNFIFTNWDNLNTHNVSAQYDGSDAKKVILYEDYRANSDNWRVHELGFGCFRNQPTIEEITIESPGFGIQKNSFKGCTNLKKIIMPNIENPPSIGNGGWKTVIDSIFEPYHFENVTLYVPIVEKMKSDSSWCRFKHIEQYQSR